MRKIKGSLNITKKAAPLLLDLVSVPDYPPDFRLNIRWRKLLQALSAGGDRSNRAKTIQNRTQRAGLIEEHAVAGRKFSLPCLIGLLSSLICRTHRLQLTLNPSDHLFCLCVGGLTGSHGRPGGFKPCFVFLNSRQQLNQASNRLLETAHRGFQSANRASINAGALQSREPVGLNALDLFAMIPLKLSQGSGKSLFNGASLGRNVLSGLICNALQLNLVATKSGLQLIDLDDLFRQRNRSLVGRLLRLGASHC